MNHKANKQLKLEPCLKRGQAKLRCKKPNAINILLKQHLKVFTEFPISSVLFQQNRANQCQPCRVGKDYILAEKP